MDKTLIIGILVIVFVDISICGDFTLALACTVQFLILFLYIIMVVTFLTGRELMYCANLKQVCLNHTHE